MKTLEHARPTGHPEARFFASSCESMRELADGEVTLTVTSPPYWDTMRYPEWLEAKQTGKVSGRGMPPTRSYEEFLAEQQRVFAEVYRVTRPGGHCIVNVTAIQHKGRCYPIPIDMAKRLSDLGWEYMHEMVWYKSRAALDRFGVLIQHPYPGYFYPNIVTEWLLVFRKPGPRLFNGVDPVTKEAARLPRSELLTRDICNNLWTIQPVPPKRQDHPCPFPEELPHRLILLYSYPGDLVLDPFLGSGTTSKVAVALGRRAVGYELEERFIEVAIRRLSEPLNLRPEQLIIEFKRVEDDPFTKVSLRESAPDDESSSNERERP
jgi:DNA modification methylase